MPVYISHSSAQSLWRSTRARDYVRCPRIADSRPANLPHSYRAPFSQGILSTTALRALPRPDGIIVEKDSDRLYGKQIRNHVWMRQIPERSFVAIEPSVRLSTPEFTYLQMAAVLSLPRLASYACEIAGGYSLNEGGRSFHALPARLGGYGLSTYVANYRIDLTESWERYLRTPYPLADLAWPTEMVATECDSYMAHGEPSVRDHDEDRKSALEDMGYTVITIRSQRPMDPMKFDNIVRQLVAPPLGVTPPLRTGLFAQRSDDLRSQLLG